MKVSAAICCAHFDLISIGDCGGISLVSLGNFPIKIFPFAFVVDVIGEQKKKEISMNNYPRVLPARKITGSKVLNTTGEELGSLKDLVVDLDEGRITYAVLSFVQIIPCQ